MIATVHTDRRRGVGECAHCGGTGRVPGCGHYAMTGECSYCQTCVDEGWTVRCPVCRGQGVLSRGQRAAAEREAVRV